MVIIESGHCCYWILKQSERDSFNDYYWILKQDMIRILKQLGHDFSDKQLCGYHVMFLCGGQYSTEGRMFL